MCLSSEPRVHFYRLIQQARPPQRADRSGAGTLPTRAYRYCEAAASAAGFGWWVFPPLEISLLWDGSDIYWQYAEAAEWLPLMPSAQFPGFMAEFNSIAPPHLQDCSPPFLTALPEPGMLQLWTGLMVRTARDWHLLVRAPANLPLTGAFSLYEGIVAADTWFGPLFTVLRINRTDMPVKLRAEFPLIQVQPIPKSAYADTALNDMTFTEAMNAFRAEDWDAYRQTVVVPNENPNRPLGGYAVAERKRRHMGKRGIAEH